MLFLSGEAADLCVTHRVSGHKTSLHLFMKPVCTGEERAVVSRWLQDWRKAIANACIPLPNTACKENTATE